MMILYDAIKTIQNRVFVFFLKKEQKPIYLKKQTKESFFSNPKNPGGLLFFEENGFFSTLLKTTKNSCNVFHR